MSTSSDSIRVVGEKDLLELARLPRGTWSGWIRNEHFEDSENGLYGEEQVVSAAIFNIVADALTLRKASIAWRSCEAAVVSSAIKLPLNGEETLVLVIDVHTLDGSAAATPTELFAVVHRSVPSPRGWIAIPIAAVIREARQGFWKRAKPASDLVQDKRRKTTRKNSRTA